MWIMNVYRYSDLCNPTEKQEQLVDINIYLSVKSMGRRSFQQKLQKNLLSFSRSSL